MSVLGLDLSLTSTGYVVLASSGTVLDHGTVGYGLKKPKVADHQKRLADIAEKVEDVLSDASPQYVVMEDYAFNKFSKTQSITGLAELTGVVKYTLHQWRHEPIIVTASHARKVVVGKSPGTTAADRKKKITVKDKLAVMVKEQYSLTFPTDDEMDAFVLAEAIRKLAKGGPLDPSVIAALRKTTKRRKGAKKSGK